MDARRTQLKAAALLAACFLVSPARAGEEGAGADTFARAMHAYAHDHYGQAFADLSPLADRGHAEAARIVWLMHRHGLQLYGQHFAVEPGRAERWLGAAAAAHDAVRSARR